MDTTTTTPAPAKRRAGRPPKDGDPRTRPQLHAAVRAAAAQHGGDWLQATLTLHRVSQIELMPRHAMLKVLTEASQEKPTAA
jgi:hypothetical protein